VQSTVILVELCNQEDFKVQRTAMTFNRISPSYQCYGSP
jgi:hypothetical protein